MSVAEMPSEQVRVSDAEREHVARRLQEAHGEGRLTLVEFDERVRSAHGAVVRADLEPLLTDLPTATGRSVTERSGVRRSGADRSGADRSVVVDDRGRHPRPAPGMPPLPFGGPCGARGLRGALTAWAVVSLINLVTWVAVVVGTGTPVHPWWIWVAGPWGLALLVRAGASRVVAGH